MGSNDSYGKPTIQIDGCNPVPHNAPFFVRVDEPENAKIICYDQDGRKVQVSRKPTAPGEVELSFLKNMKPGIYLIRVRERGYERTYKLFVE